MTFIQKQIKNVRKLVVTERCFSEVFTYKNFKAVFGDLQEVKNKAVLIVDSDVTIGFDLSKIEYEVDALIKTLRIKSILKEEIKISADFEY